MSNKFVMPMQRAITLEEHNNATIDDMVEWNFFADKEFERFFKDLPLENRPNVVTPLAMYEKSRNKEDGDELSEKKRFIISVVCETEKSEVILNAIKDCSPRWNSAFSMPDDSQPNLYSIMAEIFLTEDEDEGLLNFIKKIGKPGILVVNMVCPIGDE